MVVDEQSTVPLVVRTKRIEDEVRRYFGEKLRLWVEGTHAGNQSAAGRALGVSQGHISAVINGTRGVGLHFLLIFAAESGQGLDELLGLTRSGPDKRAEEDRMRLLLREELERVRSQHQAKEPPHEPKPRPRRKPRRGGLR
jgi:plasmid maintenance system antidote protein VapI